MKMSTGQRKTKAVVGVVSAIGAFAAGATITANADSIQVKQGDTVWDLSQKYHTTVANLEQKNGIDAQTDLIFVGQRLQVKSASTKQTYTVKSGDTLWDLAQTYHLTVAQLQQANHLTGDGLSVGQQLVIPQATASQSQATDASGTTSAPAATHQSTQKANAVQAQIVAAQQAAASKQKQQVKTGTAATTSASQSTVSKSTTTDQSAATTTAKSKGQQAPATSSQRHILSQNQGTPAASSASSVTPATTKQAVDETSTSTAATTSTATSSASQTTQTSQATSANSSTTSNQSVTKQSRATPVAPANESSQSTTRSSSVSAASQSTASQAVTSSTSQSNTANVSVAKTTKRLKMMTRSAATKSASNTSQTTDTTSQTSSSANSVSSSSTASASASSSTVTSTSSSAKKTSTSGLTSGSVTGLALKLASANIPYVWGGSSLSGMDCSGLVAYVYKNAMGISLPHSTVAQESYVTTHSVGSAKPGDILFWGAKGSTYHDAIYLGNNQFVAAPAPGQNVEVQQISKYFMPSFAGTLK